jgi:DNA (cytosine-5)-methyltransferase 1
MLTHKFIDLFAGIGGFRLALESLGAQCVFSSEIDKFACETYKVNFGDQPYGDITKIDAHEVPDFDILCAGFPCQSFSQAGLRKGIDDPRGRLFKEVLKITIAKQPRIIFLENVQGLLSVCGGLIFKSVQKFLTDLGYTVDYKVLKACDYGLPTLRPRVYIIAFKDSDDYQKFKWPQPIPLRFTMSDVLKSKCEKQVGFTIRTGGKGSDIDDRHNWQKYRMKDGSIRTLIVDEMKMMMGFGEDFKFPVSKTQAMKQIGNSVAVDVIRLIGEQIMKVCDANT